jgi:hypothetical protein
MTTGRARAGFLAAAVLWAAGCYSYTPVALGAATPGAVVRAAVTEQASSTLTGQFGPGVMRVHGMLLERDATTVSILVDSYQTSRNGELSGVSDPVRLPFDQIAFAEQKRLSMGRSILLGIAFLGGAVALTEIFVGDERVVEPTDPNDPGSMERRRTPGIGATLFRIRIP